MSLIKDEHQAEIAGAKVVVAGKTGPLHSSWTISIDDREVDQAKASGTFTLRGELPDGSAVAAEVTQSLMGPTKVTFRHGDEEVATSEGFVA